MESSNVTRAQIQRSERDSIRHPVCLLISVDRLAAFDGSHGYDKGVHQPDVVEVGVEGANVNGTAGDVTEDDALDLRDPPAHGGNLTGPDVRMSYAQ
jgi:hypothetical protein